MKKPDRVFLIPHTATKTGEQVFVPATYGEPPDLRAQAIGRNAHASGSSYMTVERTIRAGGLEIPVTIVLVKFGLEGGS